MTDTGRTRSTERLSEQTIRRLKKTPPAVGNRVVWDTGVVGFGARVTAAGALSFVLRYVSAGRERRITLGRHPDLSPSAARDLATEMRGDITRGRDPLAEREKARRGDTMKTLCERYLAEYARKRKKPSSVAQDERLIEKRIKPRLGTYRVAGVTREDVLALHGKMSDIPYEANRTVALLSKMFSLAEQWGLRADRTNPCYHVERYPEKKRKGRLTLEELKRLGKVLVELETEKAGSQGVVALLRLLLLTGCRLSEARELRWDWVDLKDGLLAFPDTKTGPRTHRIGSGAIVLLTRLRRSGDGVYVFPGSKDPSTPIPTATIEHVWQRIRKRANLEGKRIHDLRHTRGSWAAGLGANAFLVRDVLGHRNVGTTDRYVELVGDELRLLNDALDLKIGSALDGAKALERLADESDPGGLPQAAD